MIGTGCRRIVAVIAAAVALGGCGEDAASQARIRDLEARLAKSESELAERRRFDDVLDQSLKQRGIDVPRPMPATDSRIPPTLEADVEGLTIAHLAVESATEAKNEVEYNRARAEEAARIASLRRQPSRAIPALLRLLSLNEAQGSVNEAAYYLSVAVAVDPNAMNAELARLIVDPARPSGLRAEAGRALVVHDRPRAITLISKLLGPGGGAFPELFVVVHELGQTRDPAVLPVLAQALRESRDRSTRCHAATALGLQPGDVSFRALAQAARSDEYPAVRINALRALTHASSDASAVRSIAQEVLDSDAPKEVKAVAQEVVNQPGGPRRPSESRP